MTEKANKTNLNDNLEVFRTIFDSSIDGIALMDVVTMQLAMVNPAFCRMVSRSSDELYQCHISNLHPQEDLPSIIEKFEMHLHGGADIVKEVPFKRIGGSLVYSDIKSTIVNIGDKTYNIGIFRDVTERRKANANQAILLEHIEQSKSIVYFTDATYKHPIYLNSAGRGIFGLSKDENIRKFKIIDMHPEWVTNLHKEEVIPAVLRTGIWEGESAFLHRDGHEIPILTTICMCKSVSGARAIFSSTSIDITKRKQKEMTLQSQADKLQKMFDNSRYAMMTLAPPSWKFTGANLAALKLFGVSSLDEFKTLGPWDVSPEYQPDGQPSNEKAPKMIAHAMSERTRFFEWEHKQLRGDHFHADVLLTRIEIGSEVFLEATVRDITKRKQVESELRIAATAFDTSEGMIITDADSMILRVNKSFTSITGFTAEEAIGQTPRLLKSDRHNAAFYTALWESIITTGAWCGEIWNRRKNGEVYPEQTTITAVKGDAGETTHYVATMYDITNRKAAEEEIKGMAFYDPLTKLPNRRVLLDRFSLALSVSARNNLYGAALFIDLDRFKVINDTLGHDQGDLLLIAASRRIQACVREMDTVSRIGGDEFVVLIENISESMEEALQNSAATAEKVRAALAAPYFLMNKEHYSTPSIGVNLYCGKEESVETLLKCADFAMYQAKHAGRNQIKFYETMSP